MPGDDGAVQQEARGFSVEETIVGQTISICDNNKCVIKINFNKNLLLHEVRSLQYLSIQKRKTSFAPLKLKQRNIFGLALIDEGNLVHSAIVSGNFWKSIGGKISIPKDRPVGTAVGQSEGLQVIRVGEPWPVYLEGMEVCYILEPLVIQGLSRNVNLGMSFLLQKYNLKMICTEEED